MTAVIMDGLALREQLIAEVRAEIDAAGNPPVCLATVLVGDDKPSLPKPFMMVCRQISPKKH